LTAERIDLELCSEVDEAVPVLQTLMISWFEILSACHSGYPGERKTSGPAGGR